MSEDRKQEEIRRVRNGEDIFAVGLTRDEWMEVLNEQDNQRTRDKQKRLQDEYIANINKDIARTKQKMEDDAYYHELEMKHAEQLRNWKPGDPPIERPAPRHQVVPKKQASPLVKLLTWAAVIAAFYLIGKFLYESGRSYLHSLVD